MKQLLSALFVLMLWGLPQASSAEENARRIIVTGSGTANGAFDTAVVRVGAEAQGATARDAMSDLGTQIEAVLGALMALGVAETSIQTTSVSLYRQQDGGSLAGGSDYIASSMLIVRTPQVDLLGAMLDAALDAGATRIDQAGYEMTDSQGATTEARRLAIADGMRTAATLAEASGVTLGDLMTIREGGGATGPMMAEVRSFSVPVAAGEASVSVTVEMIFAIN